MLGVGLSTAIGGAPAAVGVVGVVSIGAAIERMGATNAGTATASTGAPLATGVAGVASGVGVIWGTRPANRAANEAATSEVSTGSVPESAGAAGTGATGTIDVGMVVMRSS